MAQPVHQSVHVNRVLTNISVAYMNNPANHIARRVFPVVPVEKQSDLYFTYNKNDWFRDEAQRRAPGSESAGSGYGLSTASYSCDVFAFHKDIDDQTLANADAPLNLEREATMFVSQRLDLRLEKQWADDYFKTTVWGTDLTGVASGETPGTSFRQWNDYDDSDPLADFDYGTTRILSTTGYMPNKCVLGYEVAQSLLRHPDVLERFKFTAGGSVSLEQLQSLIFPNGGGELIVARSVIATNQEGGTGAYGFIHGKGALLVHSAPNPGLLTPSGGYVFAWTGVSGGIGETIGVSNFRIPQLKATRYEGEIAFDDKLVAPDLGVFFASAIS